MIQILSTIISRRVVTYNNGRCLKRVTIFYLLLYGKIRLKIRIIIKNLVAVEFVIIFGGCSFGYASFCNIQDLTALFGFCLFNPIHTSGLAVYLTKKAGYKLQNNCKLTDKIFLKSLIKFSKNFKILKS